MYASAQRDASCICTQDVNPRPGDRRERHKKSYYVFMTVKLQLDTEQQSQLIRRCCDWVSRPTCSVT